MSLWFVSGMLAAVNPCGFILLPTYLMYFLGLQGEQSPGSTQRQTLRRALKVSASVSLGFMAVFVVAAAVANYFTSWLTENAKYATGFFGVALLVLGGAMLFGYKLPFMNPRGLQQGEKDQTFRSMFVYGVAYAVASLGCTIGFFISAVFATSRSGGALTGLRNGLAYGTGMAVLVGGLTVALAFANTGLLSFLRSGLQYMDRLAAAFVLLSGLYLLWYFYWVDLREEGDAITDWVQDRQFDVQSFLDDHRWGVAVLLFSLLGSTIAYVYTRSAGVLAAVVVAIAVVGGIASNDAVAAASVAVSVAVGGALGLRQDRREVGALDDDPGPAAPVGAG